MSNSVTQVECATRSFTAGAALSQYRRVRLDSGVLAYAGASDADCIGTLSRDTFAASEVVSVRLRNAEGTHRLIASGVIAAGAAVYAAANGKVADSGTVLVGEALTAAGADGDHIEVCLSTTAVLGAIARTALTEEALVEYPIQLTDLRVHDAFQTNLPGTAATDDLALIGGTFGSAAPMIQGVDFGGTSTTAYARFLAQLPAEYVSAGDLKLRVRGGMLTTVSDTTATVDVEAYKADDDGAVGSDICATAAQSINSLTIADKDFVITATGLAAGDVLDIRVKVTGSDTGNLGVMTPAITKLSLLQDIKG